MQSQETFRIILTCLYNTEGQTDPYYKKASLKTKLDVNVSFFKFYDLYRSTYFEYPTILNEKAKKMHKPLTLAILVFHWICGFVEWVKSRNEIIEKFVYI